MRAYGTHTHTHTCGPLYDISTILWYLFWRRLSGVWGRVARALRALISGFYDPHARPRSPLALAYTQ